MSKTTPEFVTKVTVTTESNVTLEVQYFLQTHQADDKETRYGVKVDKLDDAGIILESAESLALTSDKNEALKIIAFLEEATVLPCILRDMVEEWYSANVAQGAGGFDFSAIATYHPES